ncbi:hypothetical protein LCGC14_1466720 [marine sediment metagenome]|uniref:Putative tail fiber protein gp53-like C-terminal domain-containing protein n=1 Tax=marine sediment metagenome TaxID=412755 RepID=A0A0F9JE50_9ZZZZ
MTEDYDRTKPLDGVLISALPGEIRNVKKLVIGDSAASTGGAARIFFQDAAPTVRYDGSAFDASDNGSLWVDTNSSPDNQFNILTAFGGPAWTPVSDEVIAALLAQINTWALAQTFSVNPVFTEGVVANDAYITARNAADAANIDLIKAGTNDLSTLPDGAEMASNAAPVEDEAITNKKYVDDNEAATKYSVNPMTGDDDSDGTITFPNGMIQKWGKITITTTEQKAVTFAAAFTTKCFQVIVSFGQTDTNSSARSLTAYSISNTGFTVRSNSGTNTICRYFAIGR